MEYILQFITDYGYIALFGLLALGIVGLPVPDETLMTIVGSLAAHGTLSYTVSLVVSFAGSMTGMLVSYTVGRKLGKPFMYRYGKWVHLTPNRLKKAERWFHKYGVWTVSFGYFVPGVRHFTCYLAGVSGIRFWRYLLFAGSGALIWCTTFITLGYFVRENWQSIMAAIHHYSIFIVLIVIFLLLLAFVVFRYYRGNRPVQK